MPILTILSLAPKVIEAGSDLWKFINSIREEARRERELTPEEEAAFQEKLDMTGDKPHWKPSE